MSHPGWALQHGQDLAVQGARAEAVNPTRAPIPYALHCVALADRKDNVFATEQPHRLASAYFRAPKRKSEPFTAFHARRVGSVVPHAAWCMWHGCMILYLECGTGYAQLVELNAHSLFSKWFR